jgi:uncharacterized protein (DUF1684 family)
VFFIGLSFFTSAQNYIQTIESYRAKYKAEFLEDKNSPLGKAELKYLRFYHPDSSFKVVAQFERITDTIGFDMQTHNGVIKKYFVYGKVAFELKGTNSILFFYQSQKLMNKEGFEDYLFIPFTDETNYTETFGGGRYLDFKMSDIQNQQLIIDFNKCYNPYCAFKEGYACPIPPQENKLNIRIEAGEKLYGKKVKE